MPVVTVLYLLALVGMESHGVWLITLYDDPVSLARAGAVLGQRPCHSRGWQAPGVAGATEGWGFPRLLGYLMAIAVGCGCLPPSPLLPKRLLPACAFGGEPEPLSHLPGGDVKVFLICALFSVCARWVAAWRTFPRPQVHGENCSSSGRSLPAPLHQQVHGPTSA